MTFVAHSFGVMPAVATARSTAELDLDVQGQGQLRLVVTCERPDTVAILTGAVVTK